MECHRCGRTGTMARYTLGGRRAVVCEACGFVDIPADHAEDAAVGGESWTDALDRIGDALPEPVTVTGAPTRVVEGGEPPPALDEVGGVSVAVGDGDAGPAGGENGTEPGGPAGSDERVNGEDGTDEESAGGEGEAEDEGEGGTGDGDGGTDSDDEEEDDPDGATGPPEGDGDEDGAAGG